MTVAPKLGSLRQVELAIARRDVGRPVGSSGRFLQSGRGDQPGNQNWHICVTYNSAAVGIVRNVKHLSSDALE